MAIYDQKCKLSKPTNRQISLALFKRHLAQVAITIIAARVVVDKKETAGGNAKKQCMVCVKNIQVLILNAFKFISQNNSTSLSSTTRGCLLSSSAFSSKEENHFSYILLLLLLLSTHYAPSFLPAAAAHLISGLIAHSPPLLAAAAIAACCLGNLSLRKEGRRRRRRRRKEAHFRGRKRKLLSQTLSCNGRKSAYRENKNKKRYK
jgi:hypothetical protein